MGWREDQEKRFRTLKASGTIDDVRGDGSVLIVGPIFPRNGQSKLETVMRMTGASTIYMASYVIATSIDHTGLVIKWRDPTIFEIMQTLGYLKDMDLKSLLHVKLDKRDLRAFRVLVQ